MSISVQHLQTSSCLQEFDSIAVSVQARLECESCLISVPDEDALFALGSTGADSSGEGRSVPTEDTICQHTMELQHPLKIEDVAHTPWLSNVPTVQAFSIGAYLGAPLILADGRSVGAICAIETERRAWSDGEVDYLVEMAGHIANKIDLRLMQAEESGSAACLDETDRIIAALAQSETAALSVHASDGELLFANRGMQKQLGLSGNDLLSLPVQGLRDVAASNPAETASDTEVPNDAEGGMRMRVDFPDQGERWLRVGWSYTQGGLMLCDWHPCDAAQAEKDA